MTASSKPRLAIVSSYSDLCGNASYTKALEKGLQKYFDVTVISLNVELIRRGDLKTVNLYIDAICRQVEMFDYVNIQFEAGLFGTDINSIKKNFFRIAKACKKTVITMHRFQMKEALPGIIPLIKHLLNRELKPYINSIRKVLANNRYVPLYEKVISFCKNKNIPIIVHTPRDSDLIKIRLKYDNVFDHPLCFYDQSYIQSIATNYTRQDYCQHLSLNENKTYIGIFGFISKYKGHETAIQALQFLPENYELIIFGTQHPHTITEEETINKDIKNIIDLIKKLNLSNRVKFHRPLDDEEFLKLLLRCDFNILPYLEVKQGGSAIAALSLETNSNTIFSQNRAFFELEKYAPSAFKMFSIGNYLELAHAILSYRKDNYTPHLMKYHEKFNIHTSAELYKKLLIGGS